ncbi:MAG: hypothetical protein JSS27_15190 [Planctomycetes bacterium]|nr:hypothetical protein [Planctomycetota bacterium]
MTSSTFNAVFGHFQNLNLLFLLQDLRDGRTTRQSWLSGSLLCPVAHGLSHGAEVRELRALGQVEDLAVGCDYAARDLGADPDSVLRFVRLWDAQFLSDEGLIRELDAIWQERLTDAEAAQEFLQSGRPQEARAFAVDPLRDQPCEQAISA